MTVNAILSVKGNDVLTIEPSATIGDAAALMKGRRVGALVVTGAERHVVGIISERDVVHAIAGRGAEALGVPLSEIMTRKVATCGRTDKISALMELMTDGKFRHVPVIENGRLAGLVSIGDVVKHRLGEMESEQAALRDYIASA